MEREEADVVNARGKERTSVEKESENVDTY